MKSRANKKEQQKVKKQKEDNKNLKSKEHTNTTSKNIKQENQPKEKLKDIFAIEMFSEVIVKNPVLVSTIGLCPVVAICTSLKSAIFLSVITYLTMIFAQVLSALIFKKFEQWIRIALYSLSGMAIVAPSMVLMQKVLPEDMIAMGLYLPLLVINPLITRQCERVAVKGTVKQAFVNAVSCATGYAVVLIITGLIREILGSGTFWGLQLFDSPPMSSFTNPFAGFIVLGFLAAFLRIYFKKIDPQYAEELSVHSRSSIKKSKPKNQKSRANALITEYEKNRNVAKENQDNSEEILEATKENKSRSKKEEKYHSKPIKDEIKEKNKTSNITKTEVLNEDVEIVEENVVPESSKKQRGQVKTNQNNSYNQEKTKPIDNEMINSILAEYSEKNKKKPNKDKNPSKKNKYTSEELEKLMSISIEDLIDKSSKKSKDNKDVPKPPVNPREQEVPKE